MKHMTKKAKAGLLQRALGVLEVVVWVGLVLMGQGIGKAVTFRVNKAIDNNEALYVLGVAQDAYVLSQVTHDYSGVTIPQIHMHFAAMKKFRYNQSA